MPVALALGAQLFFVPGLETVGVLDEGAQFCEPRVGECRVRRQFLLPAAGGLKLAPRRPRGGTTCELLLAAEAVEDLELVRGAREPALLELAGHRDDPLNGGCDVLSRGGTPPCIRPSPAVGEDAAGDYKLILVFGTEVAELLKVVREV
jgi:hypothetical protein